MSDIPALIEELFAVTRKLEDKTGRKFTPDGHLVGSIGEVIAKDAFGLELMPHSTTGYDAKSACGKKIEIKATFGGRVAFRRTEGADWCIVIQLANTAPYAMEVVYNGPKKAIDDRLIGKALPSNGQLAISIAQLKDLQLSVTDQPLSRVDLIEK